MATQPRNMPLIGALVTAGLAFAAAFGHAWWIAGDAIPLFSFLEGWFCCAALGAAWLLARRRDAG